MPLPDPGVKSPAAEVITIEDPADRLSAPAPPREVHLLSVIDDPQSENLTFLGFRPASRNPVVDLGKLTRPTPEARRAMLDEIAGLFAAVAPRGHDESPDAAEAQDQAVAAAGERYFKALIPTKMIAELAGWEVGTCIVLSTDERWIPWELLHDGTEFLGRRFLLFRLPRISDEGKDDDQASHEAGSASPAGPLRVVHVIGGGIGGDHLQTRQLLFNQLVPQAERLYQPGQVIDEFGSKVCTAIADADIIHFDCHGFRDSPPRLQTTTKKSDPLVQLTLDMVGATRFRLRRGCLVFANACESNAPTFGLDEARSFGWAFYAKGAGAYIGTLGKVPVRAAFDFADRFYRALAGPAGGDVGKAFQIAQGDDTTPTRLIYCLYGNPTFLRHFQLRTARADAAPTSAP